MKTKNRLLASVLCLLMVVFCVVGLTACGGDDECSHKWGEWTATTNATCTEAGVQERKCSECGETETSAIKALGHDWNEATCSTPKTCKTCSATEGTANAHAYTVETVKDEALKSAANCTSAAVYYKSCSCGAISANDADTFTSGAALEHKDENTDHVCDYNCGKNDMGTHADENKDHACDYGCSTTIGEHSDSNVDNDHVCDYGCEAVLENCSDAENDGNHTCDICGNADISTHSYGNATCGTPATCSECGATTGSTLEHTDADFDHICDNNCGKNDMGTHADSNTDNDHVCDYGCGAVLESCADVETDDDHNCDVCGKANVTSHAHVENTALATEATCDTAAIKTYECNCGDRYIENDGDALGHNITGVTPTERLVDGCEYVMVYICQRGDCGEEVLGETVYHHNYIASIGKPATCLTPGQKTFKCSVCGDTSKPAEEIPADATGHNWTTGNVVDGVRTDTCSICNATKTVMVSDSNSASSNASDLANTDVQLKVDDNTNANIQLGQGVADAIGDKDITISAGVVDENTLKDMGVSDEQLGQIGENTVYDFNIKDGNGSSISDFGENNFVTITLPYTLSVGEDIDSIAVWFISDTCQVEDCDKGENCVDAHKLVSIEATYNNGFVTFQTNHFSIYTVTRLTPAERCALYGHGYVCQHVEGSCTKDAYDLYVCVRCHDKYIDEDTLIVADGHDYTPDLHAATCTENGYILYSCNDCDHSYSTKLNATGHAWSVEDSDEASCVADGYTKYVCTNDGCNEEYTITYAKLAHVYTDTVIPATCTADGYTIHDCDNCDYSYTDAYVDALGHAYESATWAWAADYSSATLTFVCENDDEHVMVLKATITTSVVNGTCSNFIKTTYLATVSYNGTVYTDEKIIETGTPDHNFSPEWSRDEDAHWHECVCGEKNDVSAHLFENAVTTKEPTCAEAGECTSYCVCGATKVTEIPATGEHNYQDGVCTECGSKFVSTYYLNLIHSWKNINGFAIKIQDFSLELRQPNENLADDFELIGSIRQIDITELALYVENGKLGGAAIGNVVIFNGPIDGAEAICQLKAVIDNGYIYIILEYGESDADKTVIRNKVSVEQFIASLTNDMGMNSEMLLMLGSVKDVLLPVLDTLVELHSEEVNLILGNIFNMIFTFEQQDDGSYVATLDYNKLSILNENLATKSVAEFIDFYFGEGAFDGIVDLLREILDLRLSEIPAYLNKCGINSVELMEKINELAVKMGAPDDFDIAQLIQNEQYADVKLGMLIFNDEDYEKIFNSVLDYLRKCSIYDLLVDLQIIQSVEAIKEAVVSILNMISENISIFFVTDDSGMLTSIHFNANDFTFEIPSGKVFLSFGIDIIINGGIDVTWSDIIESIENGLVEPEDNLLDGDIHSNYDYGYGGFVEYQGKEYNYNNGVRIRAYKPLYDQLAYVIYYPDCSGWMEYELCYAEQVYEFILAQITVDGASIMLLIDEYSNEVVGLIPTDTGFTAIYEDGSEKAIAFDMSADYENPADAYTAVYLAVFENPEGYINAFGEYVSYYYNAELQQYATETHHEYEYKYEIHGDCCDEDGCTVHTTCKNCDYYDEHTRYWCEIESEVEIDLSEHNACGGTIVVDRCSICGHIQYIYNMDINCDMGEGVKEDILDENGTAIGTKYTSTCTECGLVFIEQEWVEAHSACESTEYEGMYIYKGETCLFAYVDERFNDDHQYEYTYELKGTTCEEGYIVTQYCTVCGETEMWHSSGHRHEYFEIDWAEHGGCPGTLSGQRCSVCDETMYIERWDIGCELGEAEPVEVVDENGITHYVKTQTCPNCGLKFIIETWSVQISVCETRSYRKIQIYQGETLIIDNLSSYGEVRHEYEETYEMDGETCEDGYYVTRYCSVCQQTERYHTNGHRYEYREVNLSEFGLCGGYIEESYCPVCDTVIRSNIKDWCCWEYVNDNADGYSVYECCECGATKLVYSHDSEKDENCQYIHTEIQIYIVNGEEVYRYERTYTDESHNYKHDFIMNGESCTDGYTIITTCEDCDIHYEETSNYHNTYTIFALDDEHECCDEHCFEVHSCPCGYNYYIKFDEYTFTYDEELQMYVCDNCDLAILYNTTKVEEGCTLIETTTVVVKIADEEVYNYEKEKTYANHNFANVEVSVVDGVTYITTSCDKCDTVNSTEILSVEMEQHNGEYYYDYTFTPDESAMYTIIGLAKEDTYVTLYKMVAGQLVEVSHNDDGADNNQFLLSYDLIAGTTYVYRICFLNASNSGSISFALTQGAASETVCQHDSTTDFSVLLDGSETCEDGVLYGRIYTTCGCIRYIHVEYQHITVVKDRVDLSKHGACYGEFVYYSCACGQEHGMNLNACGDTWTDNEYYDEEGRLIHVDVRTCSECGLRYTRSYYTVRDHENCTLTYYYTVVINIGDSLVAEMEYTVVEVAHDYEITGTLIGGVGSSCEDGVVITYKCKDCEHEESYETYYHDTYEKEHIDLSELGSVCGGYATVYGCACGKYGSLSLDDSLCEWGDEWCELWIEDAITEGQYTINGWNSFRYDSYLYICAVTDPEDVACAYKIRFARYWLKDENSCMAYRYETWQFGYNEATGTYAYEVTFKTGDSRVYHNYVDGSTDKHVKYDCSDCGSYYYENWYYDDNNNCTKYEKLVSNTLDNGSDKYYKYIEEYAFDANGNSYVSREYSKRIYSDGSENWSEKLRTEQAYTGPFSENGRKVSYSYTNSNGESYSEEYAYDWYKGYEFQIYTHRIEGDYWYRYDYTYTFDNGCVQTEVYTNSKGAREENTYDICRFWNDVTIKNPTCTQDGEQCSECVVCGKHTESYTVSPHDHNWVQITDNWYYCSTCGLENANGVSGDIIMEDLTETYGNDEYYVVGYYARNDVEFSQYVSLILADGTEVAISSGIDFTTIDGIRAYAFSKAAVEAWATENGYTDYDVRFSFVPVGSDGSFDYGVTFTEPTVVTDTISDNVSFTDYIGAGETKSYTITPTEDGVWTFTSFANNDTYATLCDAEGNVLTENDDGSNYGKNFMITYELKAGETYTINVRWYDSSHAGDVPLLFGTAPVTA